MIKTIALIKRRDDIGRDAFREHYEDTHAPLALTYIRSMRRYVRNHVVAELNGVAPGFDCATEFWYPDQAAIQEVFQLLAGPRGEAIRRDELTFMDKPRNVFFGVEERSVLGPPRDEPLGETRKILALVRRRPGVSRRRFLAEYESGALRALVESGDPPLRCTQNVVLPAETEAPYDCATLLWYRSDRGVPVRLRGWSPDAARVVVLSVAEFETPSHELGKESR